MKKTEFPKNNMELKTLVNHALVYEGVNVNLNYIDVSKVGSLWKVFSEERYIFNGDISEWDVRKIKDFSSLFEGSDFNGDISKWKTDSAIDFTSMFEYAKFKGDISKWNVQTVLKMAFMFEYAKFKGDISKWIFNPEVNLEDFKKGFDLKKHMKKVNYNKRYKQLGSFIDLMRFDD